MSHFYGTLQGSRGPASRCGTKKSGVVAVAASWAGAVRTVVYQDEQGRDRYDISLIPWCGRGVSKLIAHGYVGEEPEIL